VPLGRSLVGELTEYVAQHPRRNEPEAPFWPERVPGGAGDVRLLDYDRQFDVASVARYYFKPALAELGLSGVRWHDLRDYYARVCAEAGIDIRKVSRWMGHTSVNTTDQTYTHLFNGSHDEDMGFLDALLSRHRLSPRSASSGRGGGNPDRRGQPVYKHRMFSTLWSYTYRGNLYSTRRRSGDSC
jgi:integrase